MLFVCRMRGRRRGGGGGGRGLAPEKYPGLALQFDPFSGATIGPVYRLSSPSISATVKQILAIVSPAKPHWDREQHYGDVGARSLLDPRQTGLKSPFSSALTR